MIEGLQKFKITHFNYNGLKVYIFPQMNTPPSKIFLVYFFNMEGGGQIEKYGPQMANLLR